MGLGKFISQLVHGDDSARPPAPGSVSSRGLSEFNRGEGSRPSNIFETMVWRKTVGAIGKLWSTYKEILSNSFQQMPRAVQEQFISRTSIIVTIGVTIVLLLFVYTFIPPILRLPMVPLGLFGAYWLGKNVVSVVVLSRYDHLLNQKF